MSPVGWSDASEVLGLRWDDGSFVVDPKNLVRSNRGVVDGGVSTDTRPGLEAPFEALTLEEWRRQNGYDPVTKTHAP